jgi:hypothetical protein
MIGSLARMVAYNKAPRTTFAVLHPKQALQLRRLKKDLRSPRAAAIGAAVLALPLGLWLGRRGRRNDVYDA